MTKTGKRIFAMLMGLLMLLGLITPMATKAATFSYTPINGPAATDNEVFKFNKDFVMDKDATIPSATFTYSIVGGTAIDATATTPVVYSGPTGAVIADVVYTVGDTEATVTVDGENKTATKQTSVDLSAVQFTEPGVYRYIITESGNNNGVTNDPIATRTLDVYVENQTETTTTYVKNDDNTVVLTAEEYEQLDANEKELYTATTETTDVLSIAGYVFYEGTKSDVPASTATEATVKSEGYTNTYDTADLTFGKEVTGNFASLDKYFEFTVVLGNLEGGTVLVVDVTEADATPHASDATTKTTAANPTSLTIPESGTLTQKFYLHDGQYITIKSVPLGMTYTITEDAEDYTANNGITAEVSRLGVAHTDSATGTITVGQGTTMYRWNGTDYDTLQEAFEAWAATLEDDIEFNPDELPEAFDYEVIITSGQAEDVKTGFTNTKDVITPTGISTALTTFLPAIILGVIAGVGIYFFSRKKKTV